MARGETILVVDDDDSVRKAVTRILARYGYTVLEASSGEDAVEIYRQAGETIDLMVTDLVMPGLCGLDLAAKVRDLAGSTTVLFISGYSNEAIHGHALDERTAFLSKPFTMGALAEKVRSLLDHAA